MKRTLICIITLSLFLSIPELFAQKGNYYPKYVLSYPKTAIIACKSPIQWESTDWYKAGGFLVIGSALYLLDEDINEAIHRNRSPLTHQIADTGNLIGNGWYTIPVIGATWLGGSVLHSPKTQDTALLSLKSLLIADGVTSVLKYSSQRYRPNRDKGNSFWNGGKFSMHKDSFPSGHTTLVWSIAPVLAEQYKDTGWVPPLVYGVACVTGYGRMHDEKHWSSDVFTGAVIGYVTARLVMQTTPRLTVVPSLEPAGVQVSWQLD
jgi:membrane-associated phospholipid phosphatase